MAQSDNIIPIPGTKKSKYLEENAGAADKELTTKDLEGIDSIMKKYLNIEHRYSSHEYKFVNK
jgi:aryl-alcohol dehydrogenase-like predicted oxidoreductase